MGGDMSYQVKSLTVGFPSESESWKVSIENTSSSSITFSFHHDAHSDLQYKYPTASIFVFSDDYYDGFLTNFYIARGSSKEFMIPPKKKFYFICETYLPYASNFITFAEWQGAYLTLKVDKFFNVEISDYSCYPFENYGGVLYINSWSGYGNGNTVGTFCSDENLLMIPASWAGFNRENAYECFKNCFNLEVIPSSWEGLENLKYAQSMFYSSNTLSGITAIPSSWEGLENLIDASSMFFNTRIVGGGVTSFSSLSNVTDCAQMFSGCSSWVGDALSAYNQLLTKVDWPNYNYTFKDCTSAIGYSSIPSTWK